MKSDSSTERWPRQKSLPLSTPAARANANHLHLRRLRQQQLSHLYANSYSHGYANTRPATPTPTANANTDSYTNANSNADSDSYIYTNVNANIYTNHPTPIPQAGSFVIGDLDAVVGRKITFWGAQWAKANDLSGGLAPSSFKGFANVLNPNPPLCGGTWQSDPGNSCHPPDSVPAFINVLAASSITKSGPVINGNSPKMSS